MLTAAVLLAVGSVVGMTIAIRGGDAVVWYRHAPEAFPYIKVSCALIFSCGDFFPAVTKVSSFSIGVFHADVSCEYVNIQWLPVLPAHSVFPAGLVILV